jgi:hypothetical protein
VLMVSLDHTSFPSQRFSCQHGAACFVLVSLYSSSSPLWFFFLST